MAHLYIISSLQTLWHRSSRPFWKVFGSLHNFVVRFASQTLPSWSCDETGSCIQSTEKACSVLDVFLYYCSSIELDLRALSEFCFAAGFVQYECSIFAEETDSLVFLYQTYVSQFVSVAAQRLGRRACTGRERNTSRTCNLVQWSSVLSRHWQIFFVFNTPPPIFRSSEI